VAERANSPALAAGVRRACANALIRDDRLMRIEPGTTLVAVTSDSSVLSGSFRRRSGHHVFLNGTPMRWPGEGDQACLVHVAKVTGRLFIQRLWIIAILIAASLVLPASALTRLRPGSDGGRGSHFAHWRRSRTPSKFVATKRGSRHAPGHPIRPAQLTPGPGIRHPRRAHPGRRNRCQQCDVQHRQLGAPPAAAL
jgi:hypothetical protein